MGGACGTYRRVSYSDLMGGACGTYRRVAYSGLMGEPDKKHHLIDLRIDGIIILKLTLIY
jgi:hypothetical protein